MSWWIGASGHIDHVPGCWHGGCGYFDQQCWVGPWGRQRPLSHSPLGWMGGTLTHKIDIQIRRCFVKMQRFGGATFLGILTVQLKEWTEPYAWDETSF